MDMQVEDNQWRRDVRLSRHSSLTLTADFFWEKNFSIHSDIERSISSDQNNFVAASRQLENIVLPTVTVILFTSTLHEFQLDEPLAHKKFTKPPKLCPMNWTPNHQETAEYLC
jgi:hypothetical protein